MSLEATIWAWQQVTKTAIDKLVLLRMANFANEHHMAYPSIERLHKDTQANRKTIITSIDRLEQVGLIADTGDRVGRTGKVKVYQLQVTVPNSELLNSTENGTINQIEVVPNSEPLESQTVPKTEPLTGEIVPKLPSNSPNNGTQNNNINNIYIINNINGFDFSSWPSLPDKQILEDWFAMRKRKKANVSQTVVNQFGKKLKAAIDAGYTVDDVMALCVERNWQGFEVSWLPPIDQGNGNETTKSADSGRLHPAEEIRKQIEQRAGHGRIVDGKVVVEAF